jgi:DNA-binding response OmpR family regulator
LFGVTLRVLLLEDDRDYRESITEYLEEIGIQVDPFENGDDALEAAHDTIYDVLLLDVMVPGTDGYHITKQLRHDSVGTPILLITSLTDINNLSIGYEMGCSDYIRKPFSLKELKYRIQHAVSSVNYHQSSDMINLKFGFSFDISKLALLQNGKEVQLTNIEKKIVNTLIINLNTYVDKYQIISDVWEDKDIELTDFRMHIKRIRDKTDKNFIVSARSIGYKIEKV